MSRTVTKGATSQSLYFFILDSTSTTGEAKTGLAFNTAGLVAYYARAQAAAVAITLVTLASPSAAFSSGGFVQVDAANMPGVYRLDVPNAAFITGADSVVIMLKGATGMVPVAAVVQLIGTDFQGSLAKTTAAIARGTVTSGATTTSIPTSAFSISGAVTDQFKGRVVLFDADTTSGALRGQAAVIQSSTNVSTPTLTVSTLTTAPVAGNTFSVI